MTGRVGKRPVEDSLIAHLTFRWHTLFDRITRTQSWRDPRAFQFIPEMIAEILKRFVESRSLGGYDCGIPLTLCSETPASYLIEQCEISEFQGPSGKDFHEVEIPTYEQEVNYPYDHSGRCLLADMSYCWPQQAGISRVKIEHVQKEMQLRLSREAHAIELLFFAFQYPRFIGVHQFSCPNEIVATGTIFSGKGSKRYILALCYNRDEQYSRSLKFIRVDDIHDFSRCYALGIPRRVGVSPR